MEVAENKDLPFNYTLEQGPCVFCGSAWFIYQSTKYVWGEIEYGRCDCTRTWITRYHYKGINPPYEIKKRTEKWDKMETKINKHNLVNGCCSECGLVELYMNKIVCPYEEKKQLNFKFSATEKEWETIVNNFQPYQPSICKIFFDKLKKEIGEINV